jgi:hypothetical protein
VRVGWIGERVDRFLFIELCIINVKVCRAVVIEFDRANFCLTGERVRGWLDEVRLSVNENCFTQWGVPQLIKIAKRDSCWILRKLRCKYPYDENLRQTFYTAHLPSQTLNIPRGVDCRCMNSQFFLAAVFFYYFSSLLSNISQYLYSRAASMIRVQCEIDFSVTCRV